MKKYVRVTELSISNEHGVKFCVKESDYEDYSEAKTMLECDARTDDFARNVRWMICTKYGLSDDDYERAYCGDSEEGYYDPDIEDDILETTETYCFEVEV